MAPVSRNGRNAYRLDGDVEGASEMSGVFDAPPSTMAAQLINDLSITRKPSRQVEQDDLARLMTEVSEAENNSSEPEDAANVEHKHKLIYVFSRAVLEKLTKDDPFMNVEQLVSQALGALDVFMTAIRETPGVLEYTLPLGSSLQGRGGEPLWIWLFPRLLSLFGRQGCDPLNEKIKDLFYESFQAVSRTPKLWNLNASFFTYLKDCAANTLSASEEMAMVFGIQSLNIVLPSSQTDYTPFALDNSGSTSDPSSQCTYVIRTNVEACCHASNLLSMLVDISTAAASLHDTTTAFEDYISWMLDSFLSSNDLQKKYRGYPEHDQQLESLTMMSFSAVQALLSSLREFLPGPLLRRGYTVLSVLLTDILESPAELLEKCKPLSICSAMLNLASCCNQHDSMRRSMSRSLVPVIRAFLETPDCSSLGNDFKTAYNSLCRACGISPHQGADTEMTQDFESQDLMSIFEDLDLRLDLPMQQENRIESGPPSKRIKLIEGSGVFVQITSQLWELLSSQSATGLDGLGQIAEECFSALGETDRCKAFELLGMVACGASGCLTTDSTSLDIKNATCALCEGMPLSDHAERNETWKEKAYQDALADGAAILGRLVICPAFAEARRPRILAMLALRKFALHYDEPSFLDLKVSFLGQWCVSSLHQSTTRELRIAAGRTISAFLRSSSANTQLMKTNRRAILELLRDYSNPGKPAHVQETCILAWGQIARVVKGDELNLVLLGMVGYLGHNNPVLSGVAFNELTRLAKSAGISVERMLSPFWGNIAIVAVKDLIVKPQTSQVMADLLAMSVTEFLILTQTYTLPWLVYNLKTDVIRRISEARNDAKEWMVCMVDSNLIPILALLLVQDKPDLEDFIMSRFRKIHPRFEELELVDLLKIEPSVEALLLLKAAGEADDSKKSRIRYALQFLAEQVYRPTDGDKKPMNTVGAFMELHMLGLVASISEVINDNRDQYSTTEKGRSVNAIEEMVKVSKSHTRVARPQICACLQAALGQTELQAFAFSAWCTMLRNLEDDDVEAMLESTFSTIIQHWDTFNESTRDCAEEILLYILADRARLIRNMIVNLPSLARFPRLSAVEMKLQAIRKPTDVGNAFQIFSRRLGHENSGVVFQTLIELKDFLQLNQTFLQASAVSEQPDIVVGQIVRSILDTCVKFNESRPDIAHLSAECVGIIGCLDPNRVESVRDQHDMVVVSNFDDPGETTEFVLFMLEHAIVPAFLSATDTLLLGFLSYVIQQLLEVCDFKSTVEPILRLGDVGNTEEIYQKWLSLPANVQDTLTPFLSSKYSLKEMEMQKNDYPIFRPEDIPPNVRLYNFWLRNFVLDLLQSPFNFNTGLIFPPLCRAIRIKDLSIAAFLLPYVTLHVIIDGTAENRKEIGEELLSILQYEAPPNSQMRKDDMKLCIEAVFRILDYLARWVQERQSQISQSRGPPVADLHNERVDCVMKMIPPELISRRAVECKSYSRALFSWEQHIRNVRTAEKARIAGGHKPNIDRKTKDLQRLQDIYTQIDEPDGIEGISAHLYVLDVEQQILGHRKAGRWTAAQSWYEIKLAEKPEDTNVQLNLLTCLRESGQHDVLLNYVEGMSKASQPTLKLLSFAAEASWATGRWDTLKKYTSMTPHGSDDDFNVNIGRALVALSNKEMNTFKTSVQNLRKQIARSLSRSTTSSLGACHDNMLKLHVLTELEMIATTEREGGLPRPKVLESLDRRLEVIGAYLNDKQYLLGIRRAAMKLSSAAFTDGDVASAWLTSARLARKGNAMHQSFNAVLHASELGDEAATIEHARLLWKEGHHRKAIQSLQGAIDSKAFISHNRQNDDTSFTGIDVAAQQNLLTARAHLLLAKWLDSAGQTHSSALRQQYQEAAKTHTSWEKGHYYLGRHYNKLLESQKTIPAEQQQDSYLTGENARLVIENYLRSLTYGTKYIYQTLPRILTLWLDLAQPLDQSKYSNNKEFYTKISGFRKGNLDQIHARFEKYIKKMPAYMFYTALPQIIARMGHPNNDAYKYIAQIIFKVVSSHPQHTMWSLLAVCTSNQPDRRTRGGQILQSLRSQKKDPSGVDIRALIRMGEKLAEQLLMACNAGEFQGNRTIWASLSKDLGFNSKACLPSLLAVPVESVLTATLPTLSDNVRNHKAFSRDIITISTFQDEVMILSSLQKPRKLTARGSDGRKYGLMCKPKDDLRKDQRLMEFNAMINRSLKRDAESSRRQLYIKTYAVTPLNEECGIIEWVDGLKTLRDILLGLYKPLGISPNYKEIDQYCEEASKHPETRLDFFTTKVLDKFPPIFHVWFVQQFPEPSAWFGARLRYTRSCAVMSMVGTILGLGDRHGENILFEEGNGGTFHVDFNCLFDKGLTFLKPERVPFRLTHNMVDAMGMYGYEGPFRKSSELTLKLLRQHEETLMTILEAFVYDPTLDLLSKKPAKKKSEGAFAVPQNAQGVLDSIQRKVKGLLAGESVPLGVEGQVDELIKQATNPVYLAGMYIGWCSFF